MSDIVKFGGANLPAPAALADALRNNMDVGLGKVILKMDKTGHWVYGADQVEVDEGGLWAVNPFSFVHGYIAWGDGVVLGEKIVPITQPLPELTGDAPAGSQRGWELQIGMGVKCVSGEDKGVDASVSFSSVGGKKAMHTLAMKVANQVDADQTKPVAIVKLASEHYQHKTYGRVYTPVFEVVDWVSMDGPEEPEPEASGDTGRRRRG